MTVLTKRNTKCPKCSTSIYYSNSKFCPECGEKLPEKETINTNEILVIQYRPSNNDLGIKYSLDLCRGNISNPSNRFEVIRHDYHTISEEEIKSFLDEHKSNFKKIEDKFSKMLYFFNTSYLINTISVLYEMDYDDDDRTPTSLDVDISISYKIDNENFYSSINTFSYDTITFDVYSGLGIGEGKNADQLCRFTDLLYKNMEVFNTLPTIEMRDESIHFDFCPYALRDVFEKTIELFAEKHPDEYAAMKLAEELKD